MNEWITIDQALAIPALKRYNHNVLHRLVKKSGVETKRCGRSIEFNRVAFINWYAGQEFFRELAKGMKGDWYTRQLARNERGS